MSNFYNFEWATLEIERARSETAGKPLENNTRLYRRSDDSFAVKLHATDVVTIHADGTYTLRAGGYHTVTTLDRIRTYAPVNGTLFSERGEWYVRMTPDKNDPRPQRVDRDVPKPFDAEDPGPAPVKNDEDCVANKLVVTEHIGEIVECYRTDMKQDDELVEVVSESNYGGNAYDRVKVKRTWNSHVFIGEAAQAYQDEGWRELTGSSWATSHVINDDEQVTYVQCSHCKDFDTVYENWRFRMYGDKWNRRFDEPRGYKLHAEMVERFGSIRAWQAAYLEDHRARRAYLKAEREWDARNRVPFYDGIIVDDLGYAQRKRKSGPSKTKLAKHEREVKRVKQAIDKYVNGFIAELKQGMPMPSNGDCWYCLMRDAVTGKTWGDSMETLHEDGTLTREEAHDHLWNHIEESYYVPMLAVNALRERGYQDAGVYMWLDMNQDTQQMGGGSNYDNVKRDITKYLAKRLVPSAPTK